MEPKHLILFSILFITLFESVGQFCLKKFQSKNLYIYFIIAIIAYIIVCGLLCVCYRNNGYMGKVNLVWSCMSIIFVFLFGYIFLNETIHKHDIIALMFALLAIYFASK